MPGTMLTCFVMPEKRETDMQLSTFLMIADAVGLKFGLTL